MSKQEHLPHQHPQILKDIDLPAELGLTRLESGKVREKYLGPNGELILIATDRVSAFDRVITTIPYKGQVLTQMSKFAFENTQDIVPNHLIAIPDPNVMVVRNLEPFPLEVIIRDYMTGSTSTSIWTMYSQGKREMYGYFFRRGYRKNEKLDETIVTPTIKAAFGDHDRPLNREEEVQLEIIIELTQLAYIKSLALFARGKEIAADKGFILVDSKFEWGSDEYLRVMDELFTPDSSRYWRADTYKRRFLFGLEPDMHDKELLRLWLVSQGYKGEGKVPPVPKDVRRALSEVYIELCEDITGEPVVISGEPIKERIIKNIRTYLNK